jgi:hypothetical protein
MTSTLLAQCSLLLTFPTKSEKWLSPPLLCWLSLRITDHFSQITEEDQWKIIFYSLIFQVCKQKKRKKEGKSKSLPTGKYLMDVVSLTLKATIKPILKMKNLKSVKSHARRCSLYGYFARL